MNPPGFLHILNPNSSHRTSVKKFLNARSIGPVHWVERENHPSHVETLVEWAHVEGFNHLAVWGGDGTFSRVTQALFLLGELKNKTLALIPVGTANDFARKTGLEDWESAASMLMAGDVELQRYDVGLLETPSVRRVFVNNAGFGRTEAAVLQGKSNPWRDVLNFKEHRLQAEWEINGIKHVETLRPVLGLVCNAPYFSGGMHFDRDVDPRDGLLNAFFQLRQSRLNYLLKFLKGRGGTPLRDERTVSVEAQWLHLESDDPLFPQVDGEPVLKEGVRQIHFSILREGMTLALPKKA